VELGYHEGLLQFSGIAAVEHVGINHLIHSSHESKRNQNDRKQTVLVSCLCCQGSGKTLAFVIPLVHHILLDKERDRSEMDVNQSEDEDEDEASDGN